MVLVYIFLILLLAVISYVLFEIGDNGYSFGHGVMCLFGSLGMIAAGIACIAGVALSFQWYAAEQKAAILNREYNVNYTQAEIFYASDVVNVIRELDRKRIEINGDFRRQRDPERNLPIRQQDNRQ